MTNTTTNCPVCGIGDRCRCCHDCGGSSYKDGPYACVCGDDFNDLHADDCTCRDCEDDWF